MESNIDSAERVRSLRPVEIGASASVEELVGLRREALELAYEAVRGDGLPGFDVVKKPNPRMFDLAVELSKGGNSLLIAHCIRGGAVRLVAERRIEAELKHESTEITAICDVRCDGASVLRGRKSLLPPLSDSTPEQNQNVLDLDYWRGVISNVREVAAEERMLPPRKPSRSWLGRLAGKLATSKA